MPSNQAIAHKGKTLFSYFKNYTKFICITVLNLIQSLLYARTCRVQKPCLLFLSLNEKLISLIEIPLNQRHNHFSKLELIQIPIHVQLINSMAVLDPIDQYNWSILIKTYDSSPVNPKKRWIKNTECRNNHF